MPPPRRPLHPAPVPIPRPHPARIKRPRLPAAATAPKQVDPAELVLVGAALGAFGVRGEVKVRPFTETLEGVVSYGPLYGPDGRLRLTPERWRPIKDGLAVSAPQITDRDAAEALKGVGLHVPRALLPPAEDDEYYHVDLLGCRVEALDGAPLGEVVAVHDFGAGDLLLIRDVAGATRYLPFTKAVVPLVDVPARRIVADPPPEGAVDREPDDNQADR